MFRRVPAHLHISPPPWLEEDGESEPQPAEDPVVEPDTGRVADEMAVSETAASSKSSAPPPGGRILSPDPRTGRLLD